ncbi:MAG: hypothetical protein HC892_10690 [Saprospiraceae bacterium]|nr:hypothetical protein [Saprospiraceae bacterium]
MPPCVGFAGWLFGGMDSKPLLEAFYHLLGDTNNHYWNIYVRNSTFF